MDRRTDEYDTAAGGGASVQPTANTSEVNLEIEGMTCANCAGRVEKAIAGLDGVSDVTVNFALNSANVHFDDSKLDTSKIAEAVADSGYSVATHQLSFDVDGMTCANCALRVEKALSALPGVTEASVNFALERADISAVSDKVNDAIAIKAIEDAGYHATSRNKSGSENGDADEAARNEKKQDKSLILLAVSALLTAPLVLQMVWMNLGVSYALFE